MSKECLYAVLESHPCRVVSISYRKTLDCLSRLAGSNLPQARLGTICETLDNILCRSLRVWREERESGLAFAKPQLNERVLQIPYNGLESLLEVERVLRRAIGSQAENVGLHVRLFNEEPCEFGPA